MKSYSRVHADIDLDAFTSNLTEIGNSLPEKTGMIAVIKTDGYGHGAVELSSVLERHKKVWGYAVASVDEAVILRRHLRKKPILILGYSFADQYWVMIENDIRPTVFSYDAAKEISDVAAQLKIPAKLHIKLDTGMSRIGFQIDEAAADTIAEIAKLPYIEIEGLFTHFATADEVDKTGTRNQVQAYEQMVSWLEERGVTIPIHHVANSAATIDLPEYHMDIVRAGIIMYGLWPSSDVDHNRVNLKPVLSLKSRVAHIKELPAGRKISYGGTYELPHTETIATIPVGYGDGYPRSLSNIGYVLIDGQKAPIRGRVCMDQLMVDVSNIKNVAVGDDVTLIGKDGDECITIEELGELSGRFNYELVCDLSKRIPRNYYKGGELVAQLDYFKD